MTTEEMLDVIRKLNYEAMKKCECGNCAHCEHNEELDYWYCQLIKQGDECYFEPKGASTLMFPHIYE